MATVKVFRIEGNEVEPPIEIHDLLVESAFGTSNIQPSISPLDLTFVNSTAKTIIDYVEAGNIYKRLCFSAEIIGDAGTINIIDGFLALSEKYEKISPIKVLTTAKFLNGITNLDSDLEGITFDLMVQKGNILDSDFTRMNHVVEKPINGVELVVTSLTLFMMLKELAENTEKLAEDITTPAAILASGTTGVVGATIYKVGVVLIRAAYIFVLLKAIIELIESILENFISPVRIRKGLNYRVALEKIFERLGYAFESPIEELDYFTYLPSSDGTVSIQGIPRPNEFSYTVSGFVSLVRKQFNAKIAELDGVIHLRSENDVFWLKNSTYVLDDILLEDSISERKNTDELVRSRLIEYLVDSTDDWTRINYAGTNYTIFTEHTEEIDPRKDGLRDFERETFNVALGNRKDSLNNLQEALKVLAQVADTVTGVFGSNQHFAQRIKNRVGMIKTSAEIWSQPKVIYWKDGSMPFGHRDLTSAKTLYEKYISEKSFVQNNYKRQRIIYEGVRTGFGLSNYIEVNRNSYFTTARGKIGKFVNLKWNSSRDSATVDFWVEDENPSKKIKESFIETN